MLQRIKVRTKLLVVVAPMLVLVLAGVVVAVQPRLDAAAASGDDVAITRVLRSAATLGAVLELESLDAVSRTSGVESSPLVAGARESVDEARSGYEALVGDVRGITPGLNAALDAVAERLDGLTDLRAAVDDGATLPVTLSARYEQTLADFAVLERAGSLAIGDADARSQVDVARSLSESRRLTGSTGRRGVLVITGDELSAPALAAEIGVLDAADTRAQEAFLQGATAEAVAAYNDVQASEGAAFDDQVELLLGDLGTARTLDPGSWTAAVASRIEGDHGIELGVVDLGTAIADSAQAESDEALRNLAVLAGMALVVALSGSLLVARSITRPAAQLAAAADRLANEQLPAMVQQLRDPEAGAVEPPEPLAATVNSRDEIGQLAESIDTVGRVAVSVAEEQADVLRRGVSELFVNLARRNQSLLDRQIDFLDRLEAVEEDPDQLERLFKLDHLATRMRRNAESLLVLAGSEPPRRRGGSTPVLDVIRAAVGEVEDFTRIRLVAVDEVDIEAAVAPDIAHVLSELMENATQFSPPESAVEVIGSAQGDGTYMITVTDTGIGLTDEQLRSLNEILAEPPAVGLSLSRSLGVVVVARLAARLGIQVSLRRSGRDGITACVLVPATLLGVADSIVESAPPAPPDGADQAEMLIAETAVEPPTRAPSIDVTTGATDPPPQRPTPAERAVAATEPSTALPRRRPSATPGSTAAPDRVDAGLRDVAALGPALDDGAEVAGSGPPSSVGEASEPPSPVGEASGPPSPVGEASGPPSSATAPPAADPLSVPPAPPRAPGVLHEMPSMVGHSPAPGGNGNNGSSLARRVPGQTMGDAPSSAAREAGAPQRSPEEIRRLLTRYRSGQRRGRTVTTPTDDRPAPDQSR